LSGAAGVFSTGTTGLLFTAVYNITGRTPSTGQIIQFQTGCGSPTSPTSDPPICVTITNGGNGPVSESVGTIVFNNSVNPNWVAVSTPSTTTYSFLFGAASPIAKFNATGENGFPLTAGLSGVSFTSIQPAGFTVSFTGAVTSCNVPLTTATTHTCGVSASFSATSPGSYAVSISGNYVYRNGTALANHPRGTLAGVVNLIVNVQDVSWNINNVNMYPGPATDQSFYMGSKAPSNSIQFAFAVQSLGQYTGTITYGTTVFIDGGTGICAGACVSPALPAPFTLAPGATVTKLINETATANGLAQWLTTLDNTGELAQHSSSVLNITVSGFTLSSNVTSVTFAPAGQKSVQLTSTSLIAPNPDRHGFAGSVALTAPYTGPAGGVLVFTYKPASSITLAVGGRGNVNVTISGTTPGTYTVTFTGTGGTGNDMTNSTAVSVIISGGKNSPTIATSLSATSIVVGTTVTDSSTLTGATATAGGTVSYLLFLNGACTAPSSTVSTVTVSNGVVPNSRAVLFNATGSYSFKAIYSGDTNNNGAPSLCETLTVTKASPIVATTVSSTSINVGATASDSSTLTGGFSAGGTVTYSDFANGACTAPGKVVSTVTVTTGVVPNSRSVTFNATGSYSFQAVYSGDTNNNGVTSACEPLTVNKASPTIGTTLSATSIHVGQTVSDSATMASFFQAGATVTYSVFSNGACTAPGTVASTVTVTNGVVPNSRAVTFNATGSYSFQAVYSGDANNNGATSSCEPLTVSAGVAISTSLSSTTPLVGTSVTDSATLSGQTPTAGGTVAYTLFTNSACTAPGTTISVVTVTNGVIPNSRAVLFNSTGGFGFTAAYGGDANNNAATTACEPLTVNKASPTIATSLSTATPVVGTSVTDSALLSGQTSTAGGTVGYIEFANAGCSAPGTIVSVVSISNGLVPNSRAVLFNSTGSFSFRAVYDGDANNNVATSLCEPLTVNRASPTIVTSLSATSISVGASVTDSATLANFFQAGGTVTYSLFSGGTCTAPGSIVSTVIVTNGVVPKSRAVIFNSTGGFSFEAVYSGDTNNNGATSACEPLTVILGLTISTSLSNTSPVVGTTVTDSATLSGQTAAAGGTVTYTDFANGACTAPGTVVSVVTVTNGVVPNSRAVLLNSTGSLSFAAAYSGDAGNSPATSACEPLTIVKASPIIATTLSANTVRIGGTVSDSAILSGFFQAGGTVTYSVFSNGVCTAPGTIASTVTVTNGVVPNSRAVTFNATGSYSFHGVYSGDANNSGATSACEPLTVSGALALTTSLSATTITVGGSVTDSATLSGQTATAGGTVTYSDFANLVCTAPATVVSFVTVTNGVIPNSRAVTFNSTGSFSFQAVYSGDANNPGVTSGCESLIVQRASPTIATTLSATIITIGGSVSDSASLTGGYKAGGTVTYEFFAGAACTGAATTVGTPVTVTNNIVPNSALQPFSSAGLFSWNAVYSGDANNNAGTSPCEPLTVAGQKSLSTSLSATTIVVGGSVTDSAALNGVTTNAGGTVTYTDFANGVCTAPGTTVSVVTVTNGAVPNSRPVTFNTTGGFSFQASYSGDANNTPLTSACEPVTVNKTSPTLATLLSSNSITVGKTVSDSATLTGSFEAGGTVTYSVFAGNICTAPGKIVSIVTVIGGVVPNSRSVTFNSTGDFSFQAVYSGDANNNGATSQCEPLTVSTGVSIQTALSATTIAVGGSVTDSATLAGQSATAGGTVTYSDFANGSCAAPIITVSVVTVANGVVPNSRPVTFNTTGSFSFEAVYSGDANNNSALSSCESLTVAKTSPTIATTLSLSTITVGQSVTDSATLSNSFNAGGSVTYNVFSNGACTMPGTVASMVTVTNGVVPNSRAVTFNSTGSFSFEAVYSGDSNNNPATSSCEALTVTTSTGTPVLLTFSVFDADDFENGVGQLQVFVNGHLVADIPAGVNHLSGSGDYAPFDNTWVKLGPFDITSFVVTGQNTVLFMDPQTSDHFALVKNVTIVQGNTLLLHVERARGVFPGFSFSYTFSNPPLMLKAFTVSTTSPVEGQAITFTATYTGGTAPFKCVFFFGDGGSAVVAGVNGMCTAVHHYYDSGSFTVKVIIIGSSTSDRVTGSISITVAPETEV
jgi:hypothetical protein